MVLRSLKRSIAALAVVSALLPGIAGSSLGMAHALPQHAAHLAPNHAVASVCPPPPYSCQMLAVK